jgi:hypothetical protein
LEQKYGSAASHVHLSRHEVDAMLDAVLQDSPTVTYLLQALKQVLRVLHCVGCGGQLGKSWCGK